MKPILEIQNISKKFRIQHENQPYLSLRDSLTSVFKKKTTTSEEFYALKDVSFTVNPGESIGIIGRNGAGKSTLLKILSSITPPSSGKIITRGRIASLLEVGTGFHPELTGRENVFLNGSILGMRRHEILKNFDAIVDFAGVEKFIDTPLKHYSSGMQLRLAFAVAAFLENEILIIDEVLAVGDAEFQKKCLGKMQEVSNNQGRTVLFVSHNLGTIKTLCNRVIHLGSGKIIDDGDPNSIINSYMLNLNKFDFNQIKINKDYKFRRGNGDALFDSIYGFDKKYNFEEPIELSFNIKKINDSLEHVYFYFAIKSEHNNEIITISDKYKIDFDGKNNVSFKFQIPSKTLCTGTFFTYINLFDEVGYSYDLLDDVFYLQIFSDKTFEELGFDPINSGAMIKLKSTLVNE